MNNISKLLTKCGLYLLSIVLFTSNIAAQPVLKEKRIYLVDVTASMAGRGSVSTPDIFNIVKASLSETINAIEDNSTEIEIITFTNKPTNLIDATIEHKDSLLNAINGLSVKHGDTNIADAWARGLESIDSTKVNYLFLLTDGLHNCGPKKEVLHNRLAEWGANMEGTDNYAFYVMLTPNAKELDLCSIIEKESNMWLIESMDINASLIKTASHISKNIYNNSKASIQFSSNNKNVKLEELNISLELEDNPYYQIENLTKSVMGDIYSFDIVEKIDKIDIPLSTTQIVNIGFNKEDFPFVYFTPSYIEFDILNQGLRKVSMSDRKLDGKPLSNVNLKKVKYKEPFLGLFKLCRKYIEPTLTIPPYKWCKPDTAFVSIPLYISFNEECIRSNSTLSLRILDEQNSVLPFLSSNADSLVTASSEGDTLSLKVQINPENLSSFEIAGNIYAITSGIDEINEVETLTGAEKIADWHLRYKRGCPIILWLLWIISALLVLAICGFVIYFVGKYLVLACSKIPSMFHSFGFFGLGGGFDYSLGTPHNTDLGQWTGERGNSTYVFNNKAKPSSKNYGNLEGKTYEEMGKDLGDPEPQVRFKKGNPVFDRDPATKTGKPMEIKLSEGIQEYIDKNEVIATHGNKVNRQNLHIEAFDRMAKKYGMSPEELKVFKGDSAPVSQLANKWGCSEKEVWKRCNNPHHIQRVLHEKADGKTIQLVPRMYHDNVTHKGGVEKVVRSILGD